MKKYIYNLFVLLLASATVTSCAEDEGTEPGSDSNPAVRIYQYTPGDGYNSDNDIAVRFTTNNKTTEAYYLVEKTSEKDAHVASMGADGYLDYVVSNGIKLDNISGESNVDVMLTDLVGEHTITAVAVGQGKKGIASATFVGLQWDLLGEGSLTSSFFKEVIPCNIYKLSTAAWYKAVAPYEDGYDIILKVDGSNVTIEKQPAYSSYGTYGTLYIEGAGVFQNNQIAVSAKFTVSAGSFGAFTETFTLPTAK